MMKMMSMLSIYSSTFGQTGIDGVAPPPPMNIDLVFYYHLFTVDYQDIVYLICQLMSHTNN